jgi:flagellar hook assembly protein FlgD
MAGVVKVSIYDILGSLVANLKNEFQEAGYHEINWNGNSAKGLILPSGIYFTKIEYDGNIRVIKMILSR